MASAFFNYSGKLVAVQAYLTQLKKNCLFLNSISFKSTDFFALISFQLEK